jgi:hypothetical protein
MLFRSTSTISTNYEGCEAPTIITDQSWKSLKAVDKQDFFRLAREERQQQKEIHFYKWVSFNLSKLSEGHYKATSTDGAYLYL